MKKYSWSVDDKNRYRGVTDTEKKTVKINKASSRYLSKHSRPLKKGAKYPGLLDTIQHELLHVKHPKMTEKQVYKKTKKILKKLTKKAKKKLYGNLR